MAASDVNDDNLIKNNASGSITLQNVISGGVQDGASDSNSDALGRVLEVHAVSLVTE